MSKVSKSAWRSRPGDLLGVHNAKTVHGEALGYLTGIMYLAPHTLAGVGNVCPKSTPACRADCLYTAGRGAMGSVRKARIARTRLFFNARDAFLLQLHAEITALRAHAVNRGMRLAIRLNGTSDIPFERIRLNAFGMDAPIMSFFRDVSFYDYTKRVERIERASLPHNLALTFSLAENNIKDAHRAIQAGASVAVVVTHTDKLAILGDGASRAFVDGDAHDLRFLDRAPCVVLLSAKGKARKVRPGQGMLATRETCLSLAASIP